MDKEKRMEAMYYKYDIENYSEIEELVRQDKSLEAVRMIMHLTNINWEESNEIVKEIQREAENLPEERVVGISVAETRHIMVCPKCGSSNVQPIIKKIFCEIKTSKMKCDSCGKIYKD